MSWILWIIALVLTVAAFCEGATQGILMVLGLGALVFIHGAIFEDL
jgi:hypothetical protein